ncbi:flavin monoamine oxidase family protein [Streptomyces sp. NPDC088560]|uniref:flavin monoamine oxidase family protein n=1 Tax=Streptomyces sp. NPDC088560 TaxID=3365868 RepID=UPI0037F8F214
MTRTRVDFAIVGAGAAGLYTAWRLLDDARRSGARRSVALFEAGATPGGRLQTWLPAGARAGLRAELGGMRFSSRHRMVNALVDELGLRDSVVPFPVQGPGLSRYFRGTRTAAGDTVALGNLYRLAPGQSGYSPEELAVAAIEALLVSEENKEALALCTGGTPPDTAADWDALKPRLRHHGMPLSSLGLWNVLTDLLSYEGFRFVSDAFGCYYTGANWNAAEALQHIYLDLVHGPHSHYLTLVGGMSSITDTLHTAIQDLGADITCSSRLVAFDAGHSGPVTLHLDGAGEAARVQADHLILAVPRSALEQLAPTPSFDLAGTPRLRRLVEAVVPCPVEKLLLLYAHRWWEDEGPEGHSVRGGRSVTDLPLHQVYYMRPDGAVDPGDALSSAQDWGVIMATYDQRATEYWSTAHCRPEAGALRARLKEVGAAIAGADHVDWEPPANARLAGAAMVAQAKAQLALLHGLDEREIPDPVVGVCTTWGDAPFGGGWNFWKPGVDVPAVMKAIRQPLGPRQPVYVVGEAYSATQAWVEGALTSSETVLQHHLGLTRPNWAQDRSPRC